MSDSGSTTPLDVARGATVELNVDRSKQGHLFEEAGARFGSDRLYRYMLWRFWDHSSGFVNFIMLNPSTADEIASDPTITRCERYAQAWGYGGIMITNLYALRSTDPSVLKTHPDPVGPKNNKSILEGMHKSAVVVAAWGSKAEPERAAIVLKMARDRDHVVHCLSTNQGGSPGHPLYLSRHLVPVPYYLLG